MVSPSTTLVPIFSLSLFLFLPFISAQDPSSASSTAPPAAASSTVPQYVDDTQFQSAILNSTNFYRYEHAASGLSWNASLAKYATDYVNGNDCSFAHSGGPYGENLAHGYADVTAAIDAWGDERAAYNWGDPTFGENTGHFTQLVWQATTTVGCGRKWCGGGDDGLGWFLVCEYYPRGNVMGDFAQQVHSQINGTVPTPASWCPQGAACDAANNLAVPWVFRMGRGGQGKDAWAAGVVMGVVVGFWAWV